MLQTKGICKTSKQIYDTWIKIYQTLLVPGTWFVRVRDVVVCQVHRVDGKLREPVRSSCDAKPNHPMCSTRTSASRFPKANFLGVAHSGWYRHKRRCIDVRERGGNITSLSYSQSNSHHRYQLLEPLHGAGFSTMPLPDTIPMGARVAACDLQPQFHGVAAAVRWRTRGILRAYVRFLTSCEVVLDRP